MEEHHVTEIPLDTPADALVCGTILTQGPILRGEVSRRTGLSAAAVTRATRDLIDAGYVVELGPTGARTGSGRPASLLDVRADREFFAGVTVATEELIGVVIDLKAGVRVARHRPLLTREVDGVVSEIADLVTELTREFPRASGAMTRLGVTVSGDVDRSLGIAQFSPFLGWRNVPLAHLLQNATGLITVLDNNVRGLTIAEQWFGAGVGASSFALVTIGAGIGAGLVVNGTVLTGAHGGGGEIGHVPIDPLGPQCRCGSRGCVEAIASDQAIIDQIKSMTGIPDLTGAAAIALAKSGDPAAQSVFSRAGRAIGFALAALANLIDPERIVLSGEGLAAYDLFEEEVHQSFATQAFATAAQCEIVIHPLSFDQWARGAAVVAIHDLITPETKNRRTI
jgi:predicted NBD/HSP70 family sugar kinase